MYGIAYISNASGSTYDLITKLETDHPNRCGNNQARNVWHAGLLGAPSWSWDFGGGVSPTHKVGDSFCTNGSGGVVADKRAYLYQGALTQ